MSRLSYLIVLLCFFSNVQAQKFDFTIAGEDKSNPHQGCDGDEFTFEVKVTGSAVIDSLFVLIDNKRVIRFRDWQRDGNIYRLKLNLNRGKYLPKLMYKADGGINPGTKPYSDTIVVFDNPTADFEITGDTAQCHRGNKFCFKNISRPGLDEAPFEKGFYTDGAGGISTSLDTCFSYWSSGAFDICFSVEDTNGCSDLICKFDYLEVHSRLSPYLLFTEAVGCDSTILNIENKTQTDTSKILYWKYDWGDGHVSEFNKKDFANDWEQATHTYKKNGTFSPKMVIENIYGCKDSFQLTNSIKNIRVNLDFKVKEQSPYCVGDSVTFDWKGHPELTRFQWTFGDPKSGLRNVDRQNFSPTHVFDSEPGAYPIKLSAKAADCPERDTVICCLHVNGPQAMIKPPSTKTEGNQGKYPEKIDKRILMRLNNDAWFMPNLTKITYSKIKKVTPYAISFKTHYLGDTLPFSNGATVPASYIKARMVSTEKDSVIFVTDTFDYALDGLPLIWRRGDPIPSYDMYRHFTNMFANPINRNAVHDHLQHADYRQDSLVIDFPNYSMKYRFSEPFGTTNGIIPRYGDDFAALSSASYPDYPFASDSLESFWDFDDPAAPNCISTHANPNPYCRYSKEKTPRHIFSDRGCFNVSLAMTDLQTGCSHTTNFPVSFEKPVASFDTSKYKEMTWLKQNELLKKGTPIEGMGLRLEGSGCPSHGISGFMEIHLDGTEPNCGTRTNHWFIGDAEKHCSTKVYIKDNTGNVVDSTYRNCHWIEASTLQLLGNKWGFQTPGWKTPGLIIQSGPIDYDTFFYHNYIYITKSWVENSIKHRTPLDSTTQRAKYQFKVKDSPNRHLDSITRVHSSIRKVGSTSFAHRGIVVKEDSFLVKPNGLADLSDSFSSKLAPGQYLVLTSAENTRGCSGITTESFHIGHIARLRAKTACAGTPVKFHDSIYYFHPGGIEYCTSRDWFENLGSCIDTSKLFYNGVNIRNKRKAKNPNYQFPAFSERIGWDFENDGIIDLWDQHHPSHVYEEGGEHTCAMWTQDSLGIWQKDSLVFTVLDVSLSVSLASNQSPYICPPERVRLDLKANLHGDSISSVRFRHHNIECKNGEVKTIERLFVNPAQSVLTFSAVSKSGCFDSLVNSDLITILGANASFEITSADTGCSPYNLTAKNLGDTGRYDWQVPGISPNPSTRDLNVIINGYGTYEPELRISQRLIDPVSRQPITCTSLYPEAFFPGPSARITYIQPGKLKTRKNLGDLNIQYAIKDFNDFFFDYEFSVYRNGRLVASKTVTDTSFSHQFSAAGAYEICLKTSAGICEKIDCMNTTIVDLSIPTPEKPLVSIYPNPASKLVTVETGGEPTSFELTDLLGQRVKVGTLKKGTNVLDVSNLTNGIFVLTIYDREGHQSHKLTIEH